MEHVRREAKLGGSFTREEFEHTFSSFKRTYNVAPLLVRCAPDVLARVCEIYRRRDEHVHQHSLQVRYDGVPLVAAILPPGTIAFEGEVDEERMGDW